MQNVVINIVELILTSIYIALLRMKEEISLNVELIKCFEEEKRLSKELVNQFAINIEGRSGEEKKYKSRDRSLSNRNDIQLF